MATTPPTQEPTTHRICTNTCNNKGHSCANMICASYKPYGDSHDSMHQITQSTYYGHTPAGSGCYGYSSSSDSLYTCPGHRYPNEGSHTRNELAKPSDDQVILNGYLNHLHDMFNKELNDDTYGRYKHNMYKNKINNDNTVVHEGNVIKAEQPNSLEDSIEALRLKIKDYNDKKFDKTLSILYSDVYQSNIIKKDEIYKLYTEINNKWNDCICHNDCTSFGSILYYSRKCVCNGNCGCDYSGH